MRYIGSKSNLLDFLDQPFIENKVQGRTFCDIFTGTTVVARHFKKKGYAVIANDNMTYSYVFAKAYIENNVVFPRFEKLEKVIQGQNFSNLSNVVKYLNEMKPTKGFIFENFCLEGKIGKKFGRNYFSPKNAERIDAIRERVEEWKVNGRITENEYYVLLAAILEAVPFVSNISGTYGAFLKLNDPRMFKDYRLEVPELVSSQAQNKCFQMDANELVRKINCDILYLDPPYNERQYAPNYHILETIAVWDRKLLENKTGLRPWSHQKSPYCMKDKCITAFEDLIKNSNCNFILFSYNNEGIIPSKEIQRILKAKGNVTLYSKEYRRFKSNSNGVPLEQHLKELLYLVKVDHSAS